MELIIATVALVTGVLVLLTAAITLVLALKNKSEVEKVHVLVNSQMTTVVARVEQLVAALKSAGVTVPPPPPPLPPIHEEET